MTEDEFEAINEAVIALGVRVAAHITDPGEITLVQEYARMYAKQGIARAAMQLRRDGRYSLAAQVMDGAR